MDSTFPIEQHKKYRGKLFTGLKVPMDSIDDLKVYYTPGVADPCKLIAEEEQAAIAAGKASGQRPNLETEALYATTIKGNTVAVVSDGSAVLGLGNIGARAGIPVMEGKCSLFKKFANVDAFPICVDTQDVEEIVRVVKMIAPIFGGINLEDISAPRCFEVERRLREELDIPVFHDDQHGTAVICLAGLYNAMKVVGKQLETAKIVISGAGAAGISIADLLMTAGATDVILVDSKGIIAEDRADMNDEKILYAKKSNPRGVRGSLADAIHGADVVIGVSKAGLITKEMVASMANAGAGTGMNGDGRLGPGGPIVFAMANPTPEIMPNEAIEAGAAVCATGRSDFPNQLNNVLVFPGIFRGALDNRVKVMTIDMQIAAAKALAALVANPTAEKIIPGVFEPGVSAEVAKVVR
ncbi:MAG: NADP-dependent malic enzyme [Candidatus Gracilibacteria bacterium]